MPALPLHLEIVGMPVSKPPLRIAECNIRITDWPASSRWLLLPGYPEDRIPMSTTLYSVDLSHADGGLVYLQAYGQPGFSAIRLPAEPPFLIENWPFESFQNRWDVEAWLVEEVQIGANHTLSEVMDSLWREAMPVAGAALDEKWEWEEGTQAVLRDPVLIRGRVPVAVPSESPTGPHQAVGCCRPAFSKSAFP